MPWTYRVMKTSYTHWDGVVEDSYGIHECFYEGEENRDKPWGWTESPVGLVGDTLEGLRDEVMGMALCAFNESVLDTSQEPGPHGPDYIKDAVKHTTWEELKRKRAKLDEQSE